MTILEEIGQRSEQFSRVGEPFKSARQVFTLIADHAQYSSEMGEDPRPILIMIAAFAHLAIIDLGYQEKS